MESAARIIRKREQRNTPRTLKGPIPNYRILFTDRS